MSCEHIGYVHTAACARCGLHRTEYVTASGSYFCVYCLESMQSSEEGEDRK